MTAPALGEHLGLGERFEELLAQVLVAELPFEAPRVSVLLRGAGIDVPDVAAQTVEVVRGAVGDELAAVVAPHERRRATLADEPVERGGS